jgi:Fe2+ or Zn2+ uptake regulation protein
MKGVGMKKHEAREGLEGKILELLKGLSHSGASVVLSLNEVCQILWQRGVSASQDSIRKALERLMSKGLVRRVGRGLYEYLRHPTLDDFFRGREEDVEIKLSSIYVEIGAGAKLLEVVKERGVKLRGFSPLEESLCVNGIAADDSSSPLKPYATLQSGVIIRISARLRIGCLIPFGVESFSDYPKIIPEEPRFIPEHISQGGTVEFLIEKVPMDMDLKTKALSLPKLKRPYLEGPLIMRNIGLEVAHEIAKKLSDYDLVEFNLNLIEQTVAEASREASSSDLALALIDGSILPGHLDPHIHPDARFLEEWPEEIARLVLERKERILRKFYGIYQSVYGSENVVLVGAIKRSSDMTLQGMAGVYYDVPDQELLASVGLEGKILGPFEKHRVKKELIEQLKKFGIQAKSDDIVIKSYYMMRRKDVLPLQIDVVFPKYMEEEERSFVLNLIYHWTEASEKHTKLEDSRGALKVPTLLPISIADETAGKKSKELSEVIERDISTKLYEIFEVLKGYGKGLADVALFVYFPRTASLRRVR